jgi:hypothetical protein
MGFWAIAALIFGGALVASLVSPREATTRRAPPPAAPDEEELWTPDALARLGTPDTVADLVAEGRADELRGLGYTGDLPKGK